MSVAIPAAGEIVSSSSMSCSLARYWAGSSSLCSNGLIGNFLITNKPETQSIISLASHDWLLLPLLFATMGVKNDAGIKFFALHYYCII